MVRLTDRLNMTIFVDWDVKPQNELMAWQLHLVEQHGRFIIELQRIYFKLQFSDCNELKFYMTSSIHVARCWVWTFAVYMIQIVISPFTYDFAAYI